MAWEPTNWKEGFVFRSADATGGPHEGRTRLLSCCGNVWTRRGALLPVVDARRRNCGSPFFSPHPSCAEVTEIPPSCYLRMSLTNSSVFLLNEVGYYQFSPPFSPPPSSFFFSSPLRVVKVNWIRFFFFFFFWLCCMRRASSGAQTSGEGGRRSSLGDADDVIRQADLTGDLSLRSGGVSACIGSVSLLAGIRHRWAGLLQGRGSLNVRDKHLEHNIISGQLEQQMKTKPPAGTVVGSVHASTLSCTGSWVE